MDCLLALGAVAAWTWYPIVNAHYLRANPHISPSTWATAQGLTTLPLALVGLFGYSAYLELTGGSYAFPFGLRPLQFVVLMLVIGLCASWIGILLWSKASQHLPTSAAGATDRIRNLVGIAVRVHFPRRRSRHSGDERNRTAMHRHRFRCAYFPASDTIATASIFAARCAIS